MHQEAIVQEFNQEITEKQLIRYFWITLKDNLFTEINNNISANNSY